MPTRTRNADVVMTANSSTIATRNAEAADGSPKGSYADAVAPRITRASRAELTRIHCDNTNVAANAPAARAARAKNREKPQSPPALATGGAPAEASPTRETPALTASTGNRGVADEASSKPPSPPAPAPAGAGAEELATHVAAKDAEIIELRAELALEKARTAAGVVLSKLDKAAAVATLKKVAAITMSTEAAGVPVGSEEYWVDVHATKKKKTNVVVKGPKPKADSRPGLHWPGYCAEGCGCDVCVAKREEPSKTAMLDVKRVSKKPST